MDARHQVAEECTNGETSTYVFTDAFRVVPDTILKNTLVEKQKRVTKGVLENDYVSDNRTEKDTLPQHKNLATMLEYY